MVLTLIDGSDDLIAVSLLILGKEFVIHFVPKPAPKVPKKGLFNMFRRSSSLTASQLKNKDGDEKDDENSEMDSVPGSEASSVTSDNYYGGEVKQLRLRADTAEDRLLWVTLLKKALQATRDEIE